VGLCPDMRDRLAAARRARGAPSRCPASALSAPPRAAAGRLVAAVAVVLLAGCSAAGDNPFTLFADPGKYQYHSCDQISAQRKHWAGREQELKALMTRAEQDVGGAIVNVLAYKADHVAASEELKVLEATARSKNCDTPANWRSNSAVR
jgi:hypothetical protein